MPSGGSHGHYLHLCRRHHSPPFPTSSSTDMQQQILLLDGRNPLSPVPSPLHATSINSVATNNANTVRPSLGIPTGPAAQMPPNGTGPVNGPATTHSHPPHTPAAVGHGHSHSHGPGHGHGHGHSHGHGHTRNIPGIQFDGMNLARSPPNAHTKSNIDQRLSLTPALIDEMYLNS